MSRLNILLSLLSFALCAGSVEDIRAESAGTASVSGSTEGTPLPRRGTTPTGETPTGGVGKSGNLLTTAVGGLAVCLGLFFLIIWGTKRSSPPGQAPLPPEVLESLGRASLGGRQHLHLIRLGTKLLLLDVRPTEAKTLAEVTDPAEVERLAGLCQQRKPGSVTASFREVLTDYESVPTGKGFLGNTTQSDWELANRAARRRPTRREAIDD